MLFVHISPYTSTTFRCDLFMRKDELGLDYSDHTLYLRVALSNLSIWGGCDKKYDDMVGDFKGQFLSYEINNRYYDACHAMFRENLVHYSVEHGKFLPVE